METYYIYTDGASRGNPGPAAAGFVLKDSSGIVREKCGKKLGVRTNNFAEYSAVILALEKLKDLVAKPSGSVLILNLDSELAVKQLTGVYRVKNPTIAQFIEKIRLLEHFYQDVVYKHVSRVQNKEAYKLVNEVLNGKYD